MDELNRTLGKLEGILGEISGKLDDLREDFGDHKQDDQRSFSSVRKMFNEKLAEQDRVREAHLAMQDNLLAQLKQEQDRAKGAGWVILGILSSLAAFVGGAVLAVFNGWLKVH